MKSRRETKQHNMCLLIHMHVRLVPLLVLHRKIIYANPVFRNMCLLINLCLQTLSLSVLYVTSAYF